MTEGGLSQEEIDALLGVGGEEGDEGALSLEEEDALKEVFDAGMKSAAGVLETLLTKSTSIADPSIEILSLDDVRSKYPTELGVVGVHFGKGVTGQSLMSFTADHIGMVAEAMMNPDAAPEPPDEISDLHESAIVEIASQMMGNATTTMANMLGVTLEIENPTFRVGGLGDVIEDFSEEFDPESIVLITFNLSIEELMDNSLIYILPLKLAKQVAQLFAGGGEVTEMTEEAAVGAAETAAAQASQAAAAPVMVQQAVAMRPALPDDLRNLDLLLDVPLDVTVELGRSNLMISSILELGPGSVVEINRSSGEAVDILVNGQLIAKGEVVVVDENFGVRITEVVSLEERLRRLQ